MLCVAIFIIYEIERKEGTSDGKEGTSDGKEGTSDGKGGTSDERHRLVEEHLATLVCPKDMEPSQKRGMHRICNPDFCAKVKEMPESTRRELLWKKECEWYCENCEECWPESAVARPDAEAWQKEWREYHGLPEEKKIVCPGMPSEDYCDQDIDCGGPFCQCEEALELCKENSTIVSGDLRLWKGDYVNSIVRKRLRL